MNDFLDFSVLTKKFMLGRLDLFLFESCRCLGISKDWWECQERRWWESDSWGGGGGGSSLARLCKCVGGSQE